jgi:hypothetical protein
MDGVTLREASDNEHTAKRKKRGCMVPGGSLSLRDARRLAQVDGGASNSRCHGSERALLNSEIRTWRRQRLGLANDA